MKDKVYLGKKSRENIEKEDPPLWVSLEHEHGRKDCRFLQKIALTQACIDLKEHEKNTRKGKRNLLLQKKFQKAIEDVVD